MKMAVERVPGYASRKFLLQVLLPSRESQCINSSPKPEAVRDNFFSFITGHFPNLLDHENAFFQIA